MPTTIGNVAANPANAATSSTEAPNVTASEYMGLDAIGTSATSFLFPLSADALPLNFGHDFDSIAGSYGLG